MQGKHGTSHVIFGQSRSLDFREDLVDFADDYIEREGIVVNVNVLIASSPALSWAKETAADYLRLCPGPIVYYV